MGLGGRLAIGHELAHAVQRGRVGLGVERRQVHEAGREAGDLVGNTRETGQDLLDFEVADGVAAIEEAQVQGHGGWPWGWRARDGPGGWVETRHFTRGPQRIPLSFQGVAVRRIIASHEHHLQRRSRHRGHARGLQAGL